MFAKQYRNFLVQETNYKEKNEEYFVAENRFLSQLMEKKMTKKNKFSILQNKGLKISLTASN